MRFLFFYSPWKKATEEVLILRNSHSLKSFPHSKFNPLDEVSQIWQKMFLWNLSKGHFNMQVSLFWKLRIFFYIIDFLKKIIQTDVTYVLYA